MSTVPGTPRTRASLTPATPTTARLAGSHVLQASPHYTTTRRHSLYGTEDRVVIDPGSRIWKVGFSGEGKPRDVFYADAKNHGSLWSWSRATDPVEKAEQDNMLAINLERCMRSVFHESLLAEPKARKVILVEHPLMPLYIKDMLAHILFSNLQVPSISFASSHLLCLLSVGRITGLVLDCGHLESTALPIFAARPLFPQLRTTPLAGSRFSSHIRALLLLFGSYLPPPATLSAAVNVPAANRTTRVPQEILTDVVIEDIKTRFDIRASSPTGDDPSDHEPPPSSDPAMSESEFSRGSLGQESAAESEFSIISHPTHPTSGGEARNENHLQVLANMYMRHSTATDLHMRVVPPVSQQTGTGRGTLIIPGWVRERAAEVLFEGGDVDESSVAEVILDALLKAMLPGFIPRLHTELLRATAPLNISSSRSRPTYDRYASLRPLVPHFAILNNPAPIPSSSARANVNAGKAPAFTPATMAWVGGSLAGALKTGGVEVAREKWDESDPSQTDQDDDVVMVLPTSEHVPRNVIPDWTRGPLPAGAPPAVALQLPPSPQPVGA
ncbi:actin-domain-containing protein [Suillus subluteus]|nr:actin-domain-containing protein [Suillus subluteus]